MVEERLNLPLDLKLTVPAGTTISVASAGEKEPKIPTIEDNTRRSARIFVAQAKALVLRLASVVDAERARLLAIGEDRLEVGQLHVSAVLGDEPLDVVA